MVFDKLRDYLIAGAFVIASLPLYFGCGSSGPDAENKPKDEQVQASSDLTDLARAEVAAGRAEEKFGFAVVKEALPLARHLAGIRSGAVSVYVNPTETGYVSTFYGRLSDSDPEELEGVLSDADYNLDGVVDSGEMEFLYSNELRRYFESSVSSQTQPSRWRNPEVSEPENTPQTQTRPRRDTAARDFAAAQRDRNRR